MPTLPTTDPALGRRGLLALGGAGAASAALLAPTAPAAALDAGVSAIEERHDVSIGLRATDLRTRATIAHRAGSRRTIASVFKTYAAAAVLRELDRGGEVLRFRVHYPPAELIPNSPVATENLDAGMTVAELCDATLRFSDNAAANLILRMIGGPAGVTRLARAAGDRATRLDRWEPDLNLVEPGDPRDTTTANGVARGFTALLEGGALDPRDRRRLRGWMLRNETSDARFRAGLPRGWKLADKTGGGSRGENNDVGVVYRPDGSAIVVAALTRPRSPGEGVTAPDAALAEVMELVVRRLGRR